MPRPLPDLKQRPILLTEVTVDDRNPHIRYARGVCPGCGSNTVFKQNRFPMNYFPMAAQVWTCPCERSFPGVEVVTPVAEPDGVYRDPDLD